MKAVKKINYLIFLFIMSYIHQQTSAQTNSQTELDKKVSSFLNSHENTWHDLNVPASDGQSLHDIVVADASQLFVGQTIWLSSNIVPRSKRHIISTLN